VTTKTSNHTEWECKCHAVLIPKYRKKVSYGQIREELKEVFRRLARRELGGGCIVRRWGIGFVVGSKKAISIAFCRNSNTLRVYRCVTGPDASRPGPPSPIPTR